MISIGPGPRVIWRRGRGGRARRSRRWLARTRRRGWRHSIIANEFLPKPIKNHSLKVRGKRRNLRNGTNRIMTIDSNSKKFNASRIRPLPVFPVEREVANRLVAIGNRATVVHANETKRCAPNLIVGVGIVELRPRERCAWSADKRDEKHERRERPFLRACERTS